MWSCSLIPSSWQKQIGEWSTSFWSATNAKKMTECGYFMPEGLPCTIKPHEDPINDHQRKNDGMLTKNYALKRSCRRHDVFAQIVDEMRTHFAGMYLNEEQLQYTAKSFYQRGMCGWPDKVNSFEASDVNIDL
jgi:hypothetical protein